MPGKNVIKQYAPYTYYHVYNRGVAKMPIFLDDYDKQKFMEIMGRHLDPRDTSTKEDGVPYQKFDKQLELLCYCLMKNHFHLVFYQLDATDVIVNFTRAVITAYSMYFNRKYKRVGSLFQGRYKAAPITQDDHLIHISRYVHLNPRRFKTYKYSSLQQYCGRPGLIWVRPERILELFEETSYRAFVEDYESMRDELAVLKDELADY